MTYDLLILGGGVAGLTAAQAAARKGLRTVLLEPNALGGVCLNVGCIPSKVCLCNTFPDMASLDARRKSVIDLLSQGTMERLAGVNVIHEKGVLCGKTHVFSVRCDDMMLHAQAVLIATGSVRRTRGLSPEIIFTSTELPDEAVILGGGASGLETATYLWKMGKRVTVLEQGDRLLPDAEPEVSAALLRSFRRRGVDVRFGVSEPPATGTVVYADGRVPATEGIGLQSVGLTTIETDAHMQTPVEGLFAAGDVTGRHCSAHAAIREAICAVNVLCGSDDTVDYNVVPHMLFTDPQVAWVGKTEAEARREGIDVRAASVSMKTVGAYLALGGDGTGVCKLVADADGTILGVHGCGCAASEWGMVGTVLVHKRMCVQDILDLCFMHPTVSEVLREAALKLSEQLGE